MRFLSCEVGMGTGLPAILTALSGGDEEEEQEKKADNTYRLKGRYSAVLGDICNNILDMQDVKLHSSMQ